MPSWVFRLVRQGLLALLALGLIAKMLMFLRKQQPKVPWVSYSLECILKHYQLKCIVLFPDRGGGMV